jgi:hypothetical protein
MALEEDNVNIRFHSEEEKQLQSNATPVMTKFTIDFKTIFPLILFLNPEVPITKAEMLPEMPAQRLTSKTLYASYKDNLHLDRIELIINEASFDVFTVQAYQTSSFTSSLSSDWHCTTDCTRLVSYCYDIGPFGHWSNNITSERGGVSGDPVYSMDFCMGGTSGCFEMRGCWKWTVDFTISKSNLMSHVCG